MSGTAVFVMIYGALVLGGGVLGYVRAGSMVSLIVGGLTGLMLVALGCAMSRGNRAAAPIAGVLAVVVLFYSANRVFMGPAAAPNPPGSIVALLVLSIFATLAILARILRRGQKK